MTAGHPAQARRGSAPARRDDGGRQRPPRRLGRGAGSPGGAFNVVNRLGENTGRSLGEHLGVDVLAFTGSCEVGRHVLRYTAGSNLKLKLGGSRPTSSCPTAPTWAGRQ
ncbi:aldehyde dehydrogenase family protein [Spirillospora sp. CA-128828]|uniref:aldehyde dehydrogenase family protein n=1 Tax=Spirillospora sp. CA-128828 TaxID=3240033 RepID=UPI003D8BD39B